MPPSIWLFQSQIATTNWGPTHSKSNWYSGQAVLEHGPHTIDRVLSHRSALQSNSIYTLCLLSQQGCSVNGREETNDLNYFLSLHPFFHKLTQTTRTFQGWPFRLHCISALKSLTLSCSWAWQDQLMVVRLTFGCVGGFSFTVRIYILKGKKLGHKQQQQQLSYGILYGGLIILPWLDTW